MKDKCEFCLGAKGGVRGNENKIGGVVVCDYCSELVIKIIKDRGEFVRKLLKISE